MPTTSRTPRTPRAPRKARAAALVASPAPTPSSDETPSYRPTCTSCGHYVMSAPLVMLLCLTTIIFFLMLTPLFVPVRAWFTGQTKMMMCADVIKKAVQNAVPPVSTNTGAIGADTVCTANYSPVCGEIEVQCIKAPCPPIRETYSNDCQAHKAGAKIVQQGVCTLRVEDQVTVTTPIDGQKITSPVLLSGEAFGGWYFEGVFPVAITDINGVTLGEGVAKTSADWAAAALAGEKVPFTAKISFKKGVAKQGYLVIKQDNPSGLPENEREMKIPVTF